jgi:hypothetical protein
MTSELRTLVEFKDVLGIEFDCPDCHAKVLHPLGGDSPVKKIHHCPVCGRNWYLTERHTDAPDTVAAFIETFKSLANHKDIFAKLRLYIGAVPKP